MTFSIVELALPDGPLAGYELDDPFVSKIGGKPTWCVREAKLKELGLDPRSILCESCKSQLFLVLQLDCPWDGEEKYFDRVMYVFGCNSRICTETQGKKAWKVFVLQRPSSEKKEEQKQQSSPSKPGLWDAIMSVPAADDKKIGQELPVKKMNSLSLEEAQDEEGYHDKQYPVGFSATRLRICEEMIQEKSSKTTTSSSSIPANLQMTDEEKAEWGGEAYESSHPMGVDKAFLAFTKRISSYPRQCVRFSPAGNPLPFCQETISDAGCCGRCGGRRVFELQLMPAILSILPTNDEKHLGHIKQRNAHPLFGDGMEWGTVMVFTCGTCTREKGSTILIEAVTFTQIEKL